MKTLVFGAGAASSDAARILAARGHQVSVAEDLTSAIEIPAPIALVVLVGSASSTLVESCAAVRKSAACECAVILASLTDEELPLVPALLDAGANDFHARSGGVEPLESRLIVAERAVQARALRDGELLQSTQVAEALRQSEESLLITLRSIGDAFIATDARGHIVQMNPTAELLTLCTLAEAAGRPLSEFCSLLDESTRTPVRSPVDRVLDEHRVVSIPPNTCLVRRDGTERSVADSAAPIRDANGKVSGAVLILRDVSAARAASAEREQLMARLVLSERMASLGTLAAGIAHEINNPLAYVITNLELLEEAFRTPPLRQGVDAMLGDARDGAERVRAIVRGLSAFSRADEVAPVPIDIAHVLDLSIRMTFNRIRQRARLVTDYQRVPAVQGDEARLSQVFMNLLLNAAQALPGGQAESNEVRVSARCDVDGNVVVDIHDTGPGMAPEVAARIFDPFFTTKPIGEGTGLGLAICHGIITSMGGQISVESEPGKGTTMRVILKATDRPAVEKAAAPPTLAHQPGPRSRVLLVDDDPSVLSALRRALASEHDVVVANGGEDGLAHFVAGETFDAILCDLMMPNATGMDLHAALLDLAPGQAARMIFITGGAFSTGACQFLESVPNCRFEKPFDLGSLRTAIRELCASCTAS